MVKRGSTAKAVANSLGTDVVSGLDLIVRGGLASRAADTG
jgi:hypothetical protein